MTAHTIRCLAVTALASLLLAACTTAQERADRAQRIAAAQLTIDRAECTELGFTPKTDAFSNCLLKLREIRAIEAETEAQRRAEAQYRAQALWGPNWPWHYDRWRRYPYRY